jgi:AsmA family protein
VAAEVRALIAGKDGGIRAAPRDPVGEAGTATLWGVIASAAEMLRAVDADLQLAAETVEAEGMPVQGLAGHLRLDDGSLAADRLRVDLPEATITGSVQADANGAEIPVLVRATVGDSLLQVEGTLTEATAAEAFQVTVGGEGEDLATLNAALRPFVDWSLPETPPYELAGTVARDGDAWMFDDLKVTLGQSDFAGTLRYETGRDRPLLTGSLSSAHLDLPEVLVVAGLRATPEAEVEEEEVATAFVEEAVRPGGEPARGEWVLPDVPLRFPFLQGVDAEIAYRGGEVRAAANLPVQELAVDLRLTGGVLTVDPLQVGAGGGRFAAWLTLDATGDPTRVELDARIVGFDASHLLALFGEDVEEVAEGGRLSARVALSAQGNTLRDALWATAGDVAVIMEGGRISGLVVEAFGFDLGEALILLLANQDADQDEETDKVAVRCLVGDFDVADGVLEAQTLVLDTTDTTVVGGGIIDLATERLALVLEPHAKDASVLTAQTPIHLEGTFGNVEVNPETEGLVARGIAAIGLGVLVPVVGAIIPFIEPGLAEDSDCHALIEAAQERHADEAGTGQEPIPR